MNELNMLEFVCHFWPGVLKEARGDKYLMSTGLQRGLVFISLWLFWKLSVKKNQRSCEEIAEIWRFFLNLSFQLWKLLFHLSRKPPTLWLGIAYLAATSTSRWPGPSKANAQLDQRLEGQDLSWWAQSGAGKAKWRVSNARHKAKLELKLWND